MIRTVRGAICLALLTSLVQAQAQDAGTPAEEQQATDQAAPETETPETPKAEQVRKSDSKDKQKEIIKVTGSRIRRVDVEGPTQVQTVTKEDMEAGGQTTLSEVLRDIPVSIAGATREESNRGAPGFSGVNLRGLGEKYTLVLIDGYRLPPDPAFDAVDIGAIPTAMIERVEILKEGAGAIYGSDAVGGVVNVITKKAFDGTSVLLSYSQPDSKGGNETRFEAVSGTTFDQGSFTITGSLRSRDLIQARDRDFIGEGWSLSGAPGSFVPIALDGLDDKGKAKYKAKGQFAADPNCTNNGTNQVFDTGNGIFCRYNFESVRAISPRIEDFSVMAKTEYELNENLGLYALLRTGQRKARDLIAPAPTDGPVDVIDPQAVQNIKNALGEAGANIDVAAGDGVRIRYRTVPLGQRDTVTTDKQSLMIAGVKGQIGEWEWDLAQSYGQIDRTEKGENGFWLKDKLPEIIASGAFNPFDPKDDGSALQSAEYKTEETQATQTRQTTVNFSGPVADLPAGTIQMAVGASYFSEDFVTDGDEQTLKNNVQGSSASQGGGKRKTTAVYAEGSIPIVTDLELNAAARYDRYEKYGDTVNPRLALKYKLGPTLLRASVGTGFRAPTLQEETTKDTSSFPAFVDSVQCANFRNLPADNPDRATGITTYCAEQQYQYRQKAADDVKPEKVFIYSFGLVYSPTTTSGLSADFYAAQIKDRIGVPDFAQLTALERDGNQAYTSKGIVIERDDFGDIKSIEAPATNLASTEVSGIDLAGTYTAGSRSSATFDYSLDGSYQLYYKVSAFDGTPLVDKAGDARYPKYRVNNTIGTTFLDNNRLNVVARTTAATKKVNPDLGDVPSFTTYDLHYSYLALFNGSLTVGAINFADLQPPKDESANPTINYDLYSYAGRSFYVRLTQNF
jgi:iron complex outermembrane receptor protein